MFVSGGTDVTISPGCLNANNKLVCPFVRVHVSRVIVTPNRRANLIEVTINEGERDEGREGCQGGNCAG